MNDLLLTKEEILIEALPYIQRYEGTTFVIKYGGSAMTEEKLKESFAKDVILLRKIGIRVVIVHGGGNAITELSVKLGHASHFYNGQRITDDEALASVMMALVGTVNKEIVRLINTNGGTAIGLAGMDGRLLVGSKILPDGMDLGAVGKIESVNTKLLDLLISDGAIPVIAPVAVGDEGELYNVNADFAAAAIASALRAKKLFYLTDMEGILNNGELLPTLTAEKAQQLITSGELTGGMVPKVSSAFEAIDNGVHKVHIINGTRKHSLLLEIFTNVGVGTQIIRSEGHPSVTTAKMKTKRDLIDFSGLDRTKLIELFKLTDTLKSHPEIKPLAGRSIAVFFQKPSLRTRISFEVGIAELGGTPVILGDESIGIGKRESVFDTAKVISRYCDGIIARVFGHDLISELAKYADVPVVNALSDLLHPCQILGDAYTLYAHDKLHPGVKVAFIGDGNNVANSWIEFAGIFPIHLAIACPKGFEPSASLIEHALAKGLSTIEILRDPHQAAEGADVLYSDVWTSMGQEEERNNRLKIFAAYQINAALLEAASPNACIMHCLPAHRGEEITDEMMTAPQSVIFEQAENRLHIQKAVLATLIGDGYVPASYLSSRTARHYEQAATSISH